MSAKFLEGVGNQLAERWVAELLTPAFVFWLGGAAVLIERIGWSTASAWLTEQLDEPAGIVGAIAVFGLVALSAFIVERFDLSILRFLEGYWQRWWLRPLHPLRRQMIEREKERSRQIDRRWQKLSLIPAQARTPKQKNEYIHLDWQQQHLPLPENMMPTRLGNRLRAAESHSLERYGLDAIVCWPRLWLLLPEEIKKELQAARAELNAAARAWLWCLLFMIWGGWIWWLALVGFVAAFFTYYGWIMTAASNYGELIKATFDLYRHLLYHALRWHLPADPIVERRVGQDLTRYLWRGL